jgi:glycosyltransferase involved in cell wall biosynthesis
MTGISVVMITKNEERAVGGVVRDIQAACPGAEILIVDSSDDRTPAIAASLGARVIRQYPPRGYGRAMNLALRSASGEVVVTLDCDDTYPVGMIGVFAQAVTGDGYDLVDGCRLGNRPEAMPLVNYIANAGFALFASVLFLRRIRDLHSGMRAYRKKMIEKIACDPTKAALPVELLLVPLRLGYKVKTVNIDYRERIGSSTMRPLESAWWTLVRILHSRFAPRERFLKVSGENLI